MRLFYSGVVRCGPIAAVRSPHLRLPPVVLIPVPIHVNPPLFVVTTVRTCLTVLAVYWSSFCLFQASDGSSCTVISRPLLMFSHPLYVYGTRTLAFSFLLSPYKRGASAVLFWAPTRGHARTRTPSLSRLQVRHLFPTQTSFHHNTPRIHQRPPTHLIDLWPTSTWKPRTSREHLYSLWSIHRALEMGTVGGNGNDSNVSDPSCDCDFLITPDYV